MEFILRMVNGFNVAKVMIMVENDNGWQSSRCINWSTTLEPLAHHQDIILKSLDPALGAAISRGLADLRISSTLSFALNDIGVCALRPFKVLQILSKMKARITWFTWRNATCNALGSHHPQLIVETYLIVDDWVTMSNQPVTSGPPKLSSPPCSWSVG